jgi:hypothetical protein
MTLRKDCQCACHAAPNAAVHVHPCCGPGSEGWPHEAARPRERDPYEVLSPFGKDTRAKPVDAPLPDESGSQKS